MASWVDSFLHTFMQVFHYFVKRKKKNKQTNKQTPKNEAAQNKEKDGAGVWLTNFNSLLGEFNLQSF